MMALQDLLAAIEAESAAEAARLRAERAHAAEAILADAERRAAELEAAAVAAADKEERQAGEQRLAAARAAASERLRQAHEAACQQIMSDVRDRLGTIRHRGDYPEILAALIAEARAALPAAAAVRVDPADELLARRLLRGDGTIPNEVTVEPALSCAGGAEVADAAGATAVNTVEARLAAAEPALRALIGRLLAGDPAGKVAPELEAVPA
jgi:vacuolar-type H+-ATPase subunit E/Vma4